MHLCVELKSPHIHVLRCSKLPLHKGDSTVLLQLHM